MGQVLHGSASTTEAVRRAIQHRQENSRALAKRYGLNQKTVAKWKHLFSVADLPTGPKEARSAVLSLEEEAIIVALRSHTLLLLDDCLYALQPALPHLTGSSLHRCLQGTGFRDDGRFKGETSIKRKLNLYPIGFFHIDIAEVRTEQGKLYILSDQVRPSSPDPALSQDEISGSRQGTTGPRQKTNPALELNDWRRERPPNQSS